ncbi:hypothetical protein ACIB24_19740 [Spongisporangium articulatum]|uniref:Uncharacterized protein n=1 Tax=Spongisporangium articulatum TaxID=3362603 RepID=A0ABW8ASC8_9ACTN
MADAQVAATPQGALPPLHDEWLRALTGISHPASEPKATCGDCVMCAGVERSGSRVTFSPTIKCCSYVPHLANFLAGRSLRGPGADSVRARIARRTGVTPLGVGLSHADVLHMVGAQAHFGRAAVVRCPHFVAETQGCAIWATRNAVCSTWFCKHERGAVGQRFWHAVRDLLIAAEERVAYRCLVEDDRLPQEQVDDVLGHRAQVRATIAAAQAETPVPQPRPASLPDEEPGWYERMWGGWAGREEEWYLRCADSVDGMDDAELASWMDGVRRLVEAVQARSAEVEAVDVPQNPTFAPGIGSEATVDVLRLIGYSPFDPLVLPAELQSSLRALDGRPLEEVQAALEASGGVRLDDDLLVSLADFGLV